MEALALSNSFSFQAIFATKDQFRISECRGLRSNRAKKLQLGSLPSYQNMNVKVDADARDALMSYDMESQLPQGSHDHLRELHLVELEQVHVVGSGKGTVKSLRTKDV